MLPITDVAAAEAPAVKSVKIDMGGYGEPPMGLDPVPIPRDNPQTPEKIALGKQLFFDPRLSVDGTLACAGCHNPKLGWSNGLSFAFGVKSQVGGRSAPTVLNAAYSDTLFWDGRAGSLEEQAKGPMINPIEMGNTHKQVVATLGGIPGYVTQFEQVFGTAEFTIDHVVQAIAAYERTLISGSSPFDRYKFGGDKDALSAAQVRGMELFRDKEGPNCAKCHRFDDFAADLTDFRFHNIGIGIDRPDPDLGRMAVTGKAEDRGRFRTPTLRNIALTAPYMHDGRFATLEQVVRFYMDGATPNPNLDPDLHPFKLTDAEVADLVSFLAALTGDPLIETPPRLP
ncbi:MAG: cytochrome-c peroxidase [Leptospirillia bacterium]